MRQATFEGVDPAVAMFSVVVAAQSFHWTESAMRWSRLAKILDTDGVAFLFWTSRFIDPAFRDLAAVRAAYYAAGSGMTPDIEDHHTDGYGWAPEDIAGEPMLDEVSVTMYEFGRLFPVRDYFGLLATTSQYAVAGADARQRLFDMLEPLLGDTGHVNERTSLVTTGRSR